MYGGLSNAILCAIQNKTSTSKQTICHQAWEFFFPFSFQYSAPHWIATFDSLLALGMVVLEEDGWALTRKGTKEMNDFVRLSRRVANAFSELGR